MADKDDIKRKAETLGIKDEKSSLLNKLDAKFPELAAMTEEQEVSERKRFQTLKKEFDVLLDMEKKRIEIALLNPDAPIEATNLSPEVAKQLNKLQSQIVNIVQGPGEEEVEKLLRENPERIEIAEGISMTEQEVFDLMANPNELSGAIQSLNELGNSDAANKLSELVGFNLQQDTLSNVIQVPPSTAPQAQVPPLEDPNLVGPTANPVENIKRNIRGFLTGGVTRGAAETVRDISSSLKRARALDRDNIVPTGSLS